MFWTSGSLSAGSVPAKAPERGRLDAISVSATARPARTRRRHGAKTIMEGPFVVGMRWRTGPRIGPRADPRKARAPRARAARRRPRPRASGPGFPPESGLERKPQRHDEAGNGGDDHPGEEMPVADVVRQPATPHPRDHHPQRHEAGADRVVRGRVRAARDVDHVHEVGGEAEAVAE